MYSASLGRAEARLDRPLAQSLTMIISCSITWHVSTSSNLHILSIEVNTFGFINYLKPTRAFKSNAHTSQIIMFQDLNANTSFEILHVRK
jgi:hypothetical protein